MRKAYARRSIFRRFRREPFGFHADLVRGAEAFAADPMGKGLFLAIVEAFTTLSQLGVDRLRIESVKRGGVSKSPEPAPAFVHLLPNVLSCRTK